MHNLLSYTAVAAISLAFAGEALATEWNVSVWGKRRAFTEHVEKLAELVSEKTNGEFTLNVSYGGLSNERENLDGISIGAFEMAQFCAGYHPDKNPSLTVLELPFLGVETLEQERALSEALYAHPAVRADLARWNAVPLMPTPMPQYNFVGAGDAPRTLDDYKGLTVRALGGIGQGDGGGGRGAHLDVGDRGAPGHGQRRGQGGELCAPRAYGLLDHRERDMVDREPQSRHGELPGGG